MSRCKIKIITVCILMLSFLSGCTDYEPKIEDTYIEVPDYTGPSLADYVNEGLNEAKDNGYYTETDYSDIIETDDYSDNIETNDYSQSDDYSDIVETDDYGQSDDLSTLEYEGDPYKVINDNIPYFTDDEKAMTDPFETYSELDDLGRTGYAFALLNESLMPEDDEERGDISSVKPTGWIQAKYDDIPNGGWLYNRCHLIAWSLAGENDNEKNLMTGTRYFNTEGMLPFELQALQYLDEDSENLLLYRATPIYEDDDMLAKGLLLEAWSDDGPQFCVYLFNVQPGITIDYQTGESWDEGR